MQLDKLWDEMSEYSKALEFQANGKSIFQAHSLRMKISKRDIIKEKPESKELFKNNFISCTLFKSYF